MLRKLQQKRDQNGFTIIEVLIVLAIAGLIMVVVFLAVPNLQKSQRNNARKTDANNSLSALSDYVSNNGGELPTSQCTGPGSGSNQCPFMTGVSLGYYEPGNVTFYPTFASLGSTTPTSEQMFIVAGAACANGAATAPTSGTPREFSAYFGIEGSTPTQCVAD